MRPHPEKRALKRLKRFEQRKEYTAKLFAVVYGIWQITPQRLIQQDKSVLMVDIRRACMAKMLMAGFSQKYISYFMDRAESCVSSAIDQHNNWYNTNELYQVIFDAIDERI